MAQLGRATGQFGGGMLGAAGRNARENAMKQDTKTLKIDTRGQGLHEFSRDVHAFVEAAGIGQGLLTIYVRHTSCSLIIQENADPDVQADLLGFFARLVPEGMGWLAHTTEGPDDMPAHIKAALTQTSISVPVVGGRPVFGTWQGIYLFEHRSRPHRREVLLHLIGEA
jgi:secondary thiamine-phosphate synthase enzyme